MLWHYRRRAEECASRISGTRSESVRQNYQQLLISWNALIEAEEARMKRMAGLPQRETRRPMRGERPRIELVHTAYDDPIIDRPLI
jgi:hypothetical protein